MTFRRLAAALGVTAMSVHRHVADRDGLHTAMVAALLEDFDVRAGAAAELPWTERLRAALLAIHDYNRSHPVLAELLLTDAPRPPAAWRTIEHLLGLLREAGLGSARASEVASILMQQQIALLLLEARALRAAPPPASAARRRELQLLELPEEAFPNILASAYDLARVDGAAWRTLATDLIVRGVASLVADEGAEPGSHHRANGSPATRWRHDPRTRVSQAQGARHGSERPCSAMCRP